MTLRTPGISFTPRCTACGTIFIETFTRVNRPSVHRKRRCGTRHPASVPPMAVFAALATSVVKGVLFGMLPAARAVKLDPVTALRYE